MFCELISSLPLAAPTSRPPPVGGVPGQAPIGEPPSAIPALARALANANPAAAAALLQHDRDMDREEQERNRVRNLWDNLRQRLVTGRGRNQPPLPQIPGGASPARERTGNEHAIPDALFSELARAFNLNSRMTICNQMSRSRINCNELSRETCPSPKRRTLRRRRQVALSAF